MTVVNAQIIIQSSVNHPNCNDELGSIDLHVEGGDGNYSYLWTGASTDTTKNLDSLSAGSYSITVIDASGETANATIDLVSQPVLGLNVTPTIKHPSCTNYDGEIHLEVEGGSGTYNYVWTGRNSSSADGADQTGLIQKNYTVVITDANNSCNTIVQSFNLLQEPIVSLDLTYTKKDPSCNNYDGEIHVTATGGSGRYRYIWTGSGSIQNQASQYNLQNNKTYTVEVRDSADACRSGKQTITLEQKISKTLDVSFTKKDSDPSPYSGEINLNVTGGSGSYLYDWSGTGAVDGSGQQTNLRGNYNYTVIVKDSTDQCSMVSQGIYIKYKKHEDFDVSFNVLPTYCSLNNGSIEVDSITGGTAPYSFNWTGSIVSADQNVNNLPVGNQYLTITDANGLTFSRDFYIDKIIDRKLDLVFDSIVYPNYCLNNNGSAIVMATGGSGDYEYNWVLSNVSYSAASKAENLPSGEYQVTVTDNTQHCKSTTQKITLDKIENKLLTVQLDSINHTRSCTNNDGYLEASVLGGSGNYSYQWVYSNTEISTENYADSVISGHYIFNVSDNELPCRTATENYYVDKNSNKILDIAIIENNPAIHNLLNGSIEVQANGGSGDYGYSWNHNSNNNTNTLDSLNQGSVIVTAYDKNDTCSVTTKTFYINKIPSTNFTIQEETTSLTNCDNPDGLIDITIIGGVGPFGITWSTQNGTTIANPNNEDLANVGPGVYNLHVIDSSNYRVFEKVFFISPIQCCELAVDSINTTLPRSCIANNGSIEIIELANHEFPLELEVSGNGALDTLVFNDYPIVLDSLLSSDYQIVARDTSRACADTILVQLGHENKMEMIAFDNDSIWDGCGVLNLQLFCNSTSSFRLYKTKLNPDSTKMSGIGTIQANSNKNDINPDGTFALSWTGGFDKGLYEIEMIEKDGLERSATVIVYAKGCFNCPDTLITGFEFKSLTSCDTSKYDGEIIPQFADNINPNEYSFEWIYRFGPDANRVIDTTYNQSITGLKAAQTSFTLNVVSKIDSACEITFSRSSEILRACEDPLFFDIEVDECANDGNGYLSFSVPNIGGWHNLFILKDGQNLASINSYRPGDTVETVLQGSGEYVLRAQHHSDEFGAFYAEYDTIYINPCCDLVTKFTNTIGATNCETADGGITLDSIALGQTPYTIFTGENDSIVVNSLPYQFDSLLAGDYSYPYYDGKGCEDTLSFNIPDNQELRLTQDEGWDGCGAVSIDLSCTQVNTVQLRIFRLNADSTRVCESCWTTSGDNFQKYGGKPLTDDKKMVTNWWQGEFAQGLYEIILIENTGLKRQSSIIVYAEGCCSMDVESANNSTLAKCGNENGELTVNMAEFGDGPYTIEWDGPSTGSIANVDSSLFPYAVDSLFAGDYTVTVTDEGRDNCVDSAKVTVEEEAVPECTFVKDADNNPVYTVDKCNGELVFNTTCGARNANYRLTKAAGGQIFNISGMGFNSQGETTTLPLIHGQNTELMGEYKVELFTTCGTPIESFIFTIDQKDMLDCAGGCNYELSTVETVKCGSRQGFRVELNVNEFAVLNDGIIGLDFTIEYPGFSLASDPRLGSVVNDGGDASLAYSYNSSQINISIAYEGYGQLTNESSDANVVYFDLTPNRGTVFNNNIGTKTIKVKYDENDASTGVMEAYLISEISQCALEANLTIVPNTLIVGDVETAHHYFEEVHDNFGEYVNDVKIMVSNETGGNSPLTVPVSTELISTDEFGAYRSDINDSRSFSLDRENIGQDETFGIFTSYDAALMFDIVTYNSDRDGSSFALSLMAADVNQNGKVRSNDITLIQRRAANLITEYPQAWNYSVDGVNTLAGTQDVYHSGYSYDWVFLHEDSLNSTVLKNIRNDFVEEDNHDEVVTWRDNVPNSTFSTEIVFNGDECETTNSIHFDAILLGDLDGTWNQNEYRSSDLSDYVVNIQLNHGFVNNGVYSVPVFVSGGDDIRALDLRLMLNESSFVGVSESAEITAFDLSTALNVQDSELIISSFGKNGLCESGKSWFLIELSNESIRANDFVLSSAYVNGQKANVTYSEKDVTSINSLTSSTDFNIYPNPTSAVLNVTLTESVSNQKILVYSLLGKVVMSATMNGDATSLDLNHLSSGVYYIEMNGSQKQLRKRIVLEK
ncbi:T9SS type A sorting domain-containing protein [Flavobacteriales bacterium]|nr:T9SS type A sorting domain-containing protein [Flavobacteriales bacterium]